MTEGIRTRFDESEIDRIFAVVDQSHLPGAAVGIAINGKPVYRKGFGLANLELPVMLTPSIRMRIGSTTKHFACLAYMLLCEEGRARIDDEIGNHVSGLHPLSSRVTMRQLMGHVGGIRDVFTITALLQGVGRRITDREMMACYETIDDLDFEPGTRWRYNNGAYVCLSAAIENVTGHSLEEVLEQRIFKPVGMHDTMLRRWDSDFIPNSATLHSRDEGGVFSKTHMGMELSGAGGMVSTMDDMLRWLSHMDTPIVGTEETWRLMRAPFRLAKGASTRYGLGLTIENYRGVEVVHHAGGVLSGNSQMIKVPDAALDISIALNRNDISAAALALQIIDVCVEGLAHRPEIPNHDKRVGTFLSLTSGRVVSLSVRDEVHMMSVDGGPAMPVSPDEDGVLQLPATAAFLQQSVRVEGDHMVFSDFGDEEALAELNLDTGARLGTRAGRYEWHAMDAALTLIEDREGLRAIASGRRGEAQFTLEPITTEFWRMEQKPFGLAFILTFDADGRGLTIDATRMRHVHFSKMDPAGK